MEFAAARVCPGVSQSSLSCCEHWIASTVPIVKKSESPPVIHVNSLLTRSLRFTPLRQPLTWPGPKCRFGMICRVASTGETCHFGSSISAARFWHVEVAGQFQSLRTTLVSVRCSGQIVVADRWSCVRHADVLLRPPRQSCRKHQVVDDVFCLLSFPVRLEGY